jgi:glutathione synthase/RimK-type ligase-like ATP-grasp enzyme
MSGSINYNVPMKKCAFLTLDHVGDYVIDDEHAVGPLEELGWEVSTISWRQAGRPWSDFDAVIIRSTWDYWNDVPAFLDTLERINRETRLANRLDLVRWNLAKTYMRDLAGNGIGIVPTLWAPSLEAGFLPGFQKRLGTDEIVVKPVVGANGEDAFRVSPDDSLKRLGDIAKRFRNRNCMIQPFMRNIVSEGEYSLFFFNGEFSHAILKIPAATEFRSQEEHGAEIRPVVPGERLLLRARQAMDTLTPAPLYARVDFIRDAADDFLVMEFELIEPSLYLRTDPQAPRRFAAAINQWGRQAGV